MPDFSLLGQGPQFQNVLAAFQGGQEARKQTDTKNALSRYSTDPEGAISALNRVDPVMAMKLNADYTAKKTAAEKRAVFQETDPAKQDALAAQSGDPETQETLLKLRKGIVDLDASKVDALHKTNEAAGSTYYGLLQIPAGPERLAAYEQVKPALKQLGAPDFDPNDNNLLHTKVMQAQSVDKIIAQRQADEKAKVDAANIAADNERAASTAAETARHNRVSEGFDGARVQLSREAGARAAAGGEGGAGKPPSGYKWGPDGSLEFIKGGPADPAVKTNAGLKPIPPKIQQGYVENRAAIAQIDDAIKELERNPNALGVKNYAPEGMTQRLDPNGVGTRGKIANIGSKIIHDRSGAAVTASETPRLKPFIPSVTDDAKAAITKLRGLRQQVENETTGIELAYGEDSGYRPMNSAARPAASAPAKAVAPVTVKTPYGTATVKAR